MEKKDVVSTLRGAAVSHKKWVGNALALIEGVPLEKDKVPVNSTECEFGIWYYSDGQNLKDIPGFKEIEKPHNKLHRTYMEIFGILYGEESKPSFFSKLIGRSHKVAEEKRDAAMDKYQVLEDNSNVIVNQLDQLEKVISAMGETQLAKYMS
jgi:hypothetical protein